MPSKRVVFLILLGWLLQTNLFSQSLYLSAKSTLEPDTKIIDSLDYKKTFDDYASLQKETFLIKNKLINFGYIESELISLQKENDSSYIATYDINIQYKKVRVFFDSTMDDSIKKLVSIDGSKNYIDIDITKLEETLELLNSEITNLGDPFSKLQLDNIKKQPNNYLYANLVITEQTQKRTIDSIIIKGYEKFPKSYVKRFLKIKNKQPFNLAVIKKKTSELENVSFANQIKEPEVLFTKDSTVLYIYVEKQQSNAFDGFLGFSTNPETNKIDFNGYLNLNLINNLNFGESFRLIYKSDESEQKTFDVKTTLPYLFGSPMGVELGLNIFKKDSTFVTVAQSAKLQYQINSKNQISAGIDGITSTNLLDNPITVIDDYSSVFYSINYSFLQRQRLDRLFPINFKFDISAGLGTRTFENTDESQTKFSLESFKIFNLNNRNSVFVRISGALLTSDSYFDNELFRFGGINSIRGFEENGLAGNLVSVLNTEYRYKVSNDLYVHSILDASYFENQLFEDKQKLYGFGFGFGLNTNAGLFKFNYSNGKSENQAFKLSDSKIHLSLTASF